MKSTGWITIALLAQGALVASTQGLGGHLDIGVGYRQDSLKLLTENNQVTNQGDPLQSTFHLNALSIYQLIGQYETDHCSPIFFNLLASHGWIAQGHDDSNEQLRLSPLTKRSSSSKSGTLLGKVSNDTTSGRGVRGDTNDLMARVGYRFFLGNKHFSIAPLVGFAYDQLHAFVRHPSDQIQTFHKKNFRQIPQPTTFTVQSRGFLAGFEADYLLNRCWRFYLGSAWNWQRTDTFWRLDDELFTDAASGDITTKKAGASITTVTIPKQFTGSLTSKSAERMHPQGAEVHGGFFYTQNGWQIGLRGNYSYLYTRRGTGATTAFRGFVGSNNVTTTIRPTSPTTTTTTRSTLTPSGKLTPTRNSASRGLQETLKLKDTVRRFHWDNWSVQLMLGYNF